MGCLHQNPLPCHTDLCWKEFQKTVTWPGVISELKKNSPNNSNNNNNDDDDNDDDNKNYTRKFNQSMFWKTPLLPDIGSHWDCGSQHLNWTSSNLTKIPTWEGTVDKKKGPLPKKVFAIDICREENKLGLCFVSFSVFFFKHLNISL